MDESVEPWGITINGCQIGDPHTQNTVTYLDRSIGMEEKSSDPPATEERSVTHILYRTNVLGKIIKTTRHERSDGRSADVLKKIL
jgi:hypothetical protein